MHSWKKIKSCHIILFPISLLDVPSRKTSDMGTMSEMVSFRAFFNALLCKCCFKYELLCYLSFMVQNNIPLVAM